MAEGNEQLSRLRQEIRELRAENDRLGEDVERFRTATEDCLQQIDWCIGYFVGANKGSLAKSLGANRSYIRRHLLQRPEQTVPTEPTTPSDRKATHS